MNKSCVIEVGGILHAICSTHIGDWSWPGVYERERAEKQEFVDSSGLLLQRNA